MANFVLVHGGWDGGWCWRKVARLLRAQGHEVFAPTLTGLGERSHLTAMAISLDTHIRDVANVIVWEELDDVVLCGHSAGGPVVLGVADAMPERIAAVVYLDALIPEHGQSTLDLLDPARAAEFLGHAAAAGGALVPPPRSSSAREEADRAWVVARMTAHPLGALAQAISLTGAYRQVPRHIAAYAEDFVFGRRFADAIGARPGFEVRWMPGGHALMVDDPAAVAALLQEAAS